MFDLHGVESWPEADYGNHRALICVTTPSDAVWAHIEWRRRDRHPEQKDIRIFDAATGERIMNVVRVNVNREYGELVFQPATVPANYEIYYLPFPTDALRPRGHYEGKSWEYFTPEDTADPAWLQRNGLTPELLPNEKWKSLPQATVLEIQARTEFDRFDPMEVIATQQETTQLLARHPNRSYLLFPEDRQYAIRMFDDLPLRWIQRGPTNNFLGHAQPGEYYPLQLGVWAAREQIDNLTVAFSDLTSLAGEAIPASEITCFNLEGTDWLGRPMQKVFRAGQGKIRPLWIGVQIPKDAAGTYQGTIKIQPQGALETTVQVTINVGGPVLEDAGDSELWRLSRLRWLNSTLGLDDETVPPYTPLEVAGNTIKCLGREVRFGETGLPTSIITHFDRSQINPHKSQEILAAPVELIVETDAGPVNWTVGPTKLAKATPGVVVRESTADSALLAKTTWTQMESDGSIVFRVVLEAKAPVDIGDISLNIPVKREVATYMMGMGKRAGYRPAQWEWTWLRRNSMVWLGDVDAGLQCTLLDDDETIAPFMEYVATGDQSWSKGGCNITEADEEVLVHAYTGERRMKAGEQLALRFQFFVTPFKPIYKEHWNRRYESGSVEGGGSPDFWLIDGGASIMHVHHTNPANPYIGYSFLRADLLAAAVKDFKDKGGLGTNLYYLGHWAVSNRVVEMWPLRSLGDEIFPTDGVDIYMDEVDDSGGGHPWLREHLVSGYTPGWMGGVPSTGETDASIVLTGLSRWHNYWIEGWRWLVENTGVDGIYLDGINYDRQIMQRVAKVLYRTTGNYHYRIQFHCNDCYGPGPDGGPHVGPSNLFMEHFPYLSDLWFGEQFDYNRSPDFWLVEISGIPFGLTGEMLSEMREEGSNPYRGMIYGMTNRRHPSHRAMWKLWDEFGIQDAEMMAYWAEDCPVATGRDDVLATVYQKRDKTLISLASWADEPVSVSLGIDWNALGLDASKAKLTAPAIANFQEAAQFSPNEEIPIEVGKGWLLILDETE